MAKITISIELDSSETLQEVLQSNGLLPFQAQGQPAAEVPTQLEKSVEETRKDLIETREQVSSYIKSIQAPEVSTQPAAEVSTQPAKEVPTQPAAEATPLDEEAPKSENGVTLAALRETLSSKVGTHRAALKEKLNSLDAATVSTLAPEHYDEFMTFMQGLK